MSKRSVGFGSANFGEYLAGERPPLSLEVKLRRPPEGGEFESLPTPFAQIEASGLSGTSYLGRLSADQAGLKRDVIIKALKDWRPSHSLTTETAGNNQLIGRVFQDEFSALSEFPDSDDEPVVRIIPFNVSAPQAGGLDELLPLFFCKRQQVYFNPPCPNCGEPLTDCRDESLLTQTGLRPYSSSPYRYLYCPKCVSGASSDGKRFYAYESDGSAPGVVGDRWELIRDFARLVLGSGKTKLPAFPCVGCSYAKSCYSGTEKDAGGEASRLLVPFSFYQFKAFVHEFLPLHFDEYCDLAGGQHWQDLKQSLADNHEFDRLQVLETIEYPPDMFADLLFANDDNGRPGLEVSYIKLAVFEEMCKGVRAVHQRLQRPHLSIRPMNAWLDFGNAGKTVPPFWDFRCRLTGLDSALPILEDIHVSEGGALRYQPPQQFNIAYTHPAIVSGLFRQSHSGKLTIRAVDSQEENTHVVVANLEATGVNLADCRGSDLVRIRFGRGQGFQESFDVDFISSGSSDGSLRLSSLPVALASPALVQMRNLGAAPRFDIPFRVHRSFGIECDLYSLGMMLFRALLANKSQDMSRVHQRCRDIAALLEQTFSREGVDQSGTHLRSNLFEQLRLELTNEIFDRKNIFYEPDEASARALPPALWQNILTLGFCLITQIPSFSYAYTLADGSVQSSWDSLDAVLRDLENITQSIKQALFVDPPVMDDDIHAVLTELTEDPSWLDKISAGMRAQSEADLVPGDSSAAGKAANKEQQRVEPTGGKPVGAPKRTKPPREGVKVEASKDAGGPAPLDETIIASRAGVHRQGTTRDAPAATGPVGGPAADLDETIIVSRDSGAGGGAIPASGSPGARRGDAKPAGEAQKDNEGEDYGELAETIIVRPRADNPDKNK